MSRTEPPTVARVPSGDGELVITESVLAEIAYLEAMSTPGVVPPHEGFVRGVLGRKRPKGVVVESAPDAEEAPQAGRRPEVAFHLTLGVRAGVCIPVAANELRRRVAQAVTAKTGYAVRAVNVLVDHVELE